MDAISDLAPIEIYGATENWECLLFVMKNDLHKQIISQHEERFMSILKPMYDGPLYFITQGEPFPEIPRSSVDLMIDAWADRAAKARDALYTSGVLKLEARLDALLARVPYSSVYLRSSHWKRMRELAIEHYGARCSFCGSEEKLDVHHRKGPTYNAYHRRGCERLEDLSVFCRECHTALHEKAA